MHGYDGGIVISCCFQQLDEVMGSDMEFISNFMIRSL